MLPDATLRVIMSGVTPVNMSARAALYESCAAASNSSSVIAMVVAKVTTAA